MSITLRDSIRLRDLAQSVDGQLTGDGDVVIRGAATIRDACPDDITLCDHPKLIKRLAASPAAAALVPPGIEPGDISYITVPDVHQSFARIVAQFRPQRTHQSVGISPAAHISPTAQIGEETSIHPGACIGDEAIVGRRCVIHSGAQIMAGCRLGDDVVIFPNAVLYENTIVGDRTIIHSGAVLGANGFGYETLDGKHCLSAQLGFVEIGADVEIGACTTIDRGTYGPTVVGDGTKIDNQVMIAHNCRIGRHNLLCSQVGIAGSCTTGDYVVMAGQVGVRDHVDIGDHVTIGAQSGVRCSIPTGTICFGTPATNQRDQLAKQGAMAKLPEMRQQLKAHQRKLDEIMRLLDSVARPDAA